MTLGYLNKKEEMEGEKKRGNGFLIFAAFLLSSAYNYFGGNMFSAGGFDFYLFLPVAAAGIVFCLTVFLVSPDLERMEVLWKQMWVLLLPLMFPFLWSFIIWIVNSANLVEMRKGVIVTAYLMSGIGMMAALTYLAGEDAVWIHLASLIVSNGATMVTVMLDGGISEFFRQLFALIVSFAGETGELMARLEIHGITYALGCYLVYFLVEEKNIKTHKVLFILTVFFFFTGLKRIALAGVVAAGLVGALWRRIERFPGISRFLYRLTGIGFLVLALAYVGAIFYGLYGFLEQLGINTSARADIYDMYKPYYSFSPIFLGNGIGWVEAQMSIWSETATDLVYNTHSEYLKQFIELGMAGFLIWCCLRCHFQISYASRKLGYRGGVLAFAMVAYIAATYATDTTATQVFINNAFGIILLSYRLKDRIREKRMENQRINRMRSEVYLPGDVFEKNIEGKTG